MRSEAAMARPAVAPPDEDPNVTLLCSSPPCFMHELDPSWLGYLGQEEVAALLRDLLASAWSGTLLERAWLRAMLRRHLAPLRAPMATPLPAMPLQLAERLRVALPRLHDAALRDDLRQVLGMLERDMRREGGAAMDWDEVRRWRKAQRAELIARRLAVPAEDRAARDAAIAARLRPCLPSGGAGVIGFYWPFRGEYDPRPLMRVLHAEGMRLALPVVVERGRPLAFRRWWPGIRMVPGIWEIPVPAEGDAVQPDVLVAPVVGFDGRGYRLGYGGGYYDRTLAAMPARPLAIGVGFEMSALETIHPQPHDIPMRRIVTERRVVEVGAGPPPG